MLVDGISLIEGSDINNAVVDSGTTFPSSPTTGELFYKTTAPIGLNVYDGTAWAVVGASAGIPALTSGEIGFGVAGVLSSSPKLAFISAASLLVLGTTGGDAGISIATGVNTFTIDGGSTQTIIQGSYTAAGGAGGSMSIIGGGGLNAGAGGNMLVGGGRGGNSGGAGGAIILSTAATGAIIERFRILNTGALSVGSGGTSTGTSGQVLTSAGSASPPAWADNFPRKLPRSSSFTGTIADTGNRVVVAGGVTIPASVYAAGDAFSLYNSTSNPITITQGSGLTLRHDGTINVGDRTLAGYGSCFIWFNTATEAIINGSIS